MPTPNEPARLLAAHCEVIFLVGGAAVGAVIRYLVVAAWSGPVLSLVGIGVMTVLAGFLVGLALGSPAGRTKGFALGLGGSTASMSLYAVAGVTSRIVASLAFLISVPLLTATALVLGVIAIGTWTRIAGQRAR
jgi:hypothetical protein